MIPDVFTGNDMESQQDEERNVESKESYNILSKSEHNRAEKTPHSPATAPPVNSESPKVNGAVIKLEEEDHRRSTPPEHLTEGSAPPSEKIAAAADAEEGVEVESSEDDEEKLVINDEICEKKVQEEEGVEDDDDEAVAGETTSVAAEEEKEQRTQPKRALEEEEPIEVASKKPRLVEDLISFDDYSSVSQVEGAMSSIKRDLEALDVLMHQTEEEWNNLLRLQKRKEEIYVRLSRKKQVLLMSGDEDSNSPESHSKENDSKMMFLPQGGYSSLGASQLPLMMMNHLIKGSLFPQPVSAKHEPRSGLSCSSNSSNISVIDIHTNISKSSSLDTPQISISPEVQSKLSKQLNSSLASMKPILPKPPAVSVGSTNSRGSSPQRAYPVTGYGPQGPTISVHHLIAKHRKENPNLPPIRGAKRGAWRQRYDCEKRSSSREPPDQRPSSVSSSNSETDVRLSGSGGGSKTSSREGGSSVSNLLALNDPSYSYKDVLIQFAQLTQSEKQPPGSPQISIIPVGSAEANKKVEPSPDSTSVSVSREYSGSSMPPNLDGTSALAKLLLESRAGGTQTGGHHKTTPVDLSSAINAASPQYLTLSALLSGGSTTTVKEKNSGSQAESRSSKKSEEGGGGSSSSSSNPKCQGCHKSRAQFVCAGCGNQWYCSRECQVAAWEEHSEHCTN